MKIVKHSNSTWPLKIQAFVFINSSENKLGTLHVVQLFSRISVDLQAEWQLQLDTSALVPGHDSRSQISLVLNVCYNSALLALQVFFFTFVFCCHCLHPFCLFETRFVVLSDLDSGQHYKLCLDMDGVSTALLPGQHSTQELRRIEFCFFQYLKFKVTPRSCFSFVLFFPHNSHIFQACSKRWSRTCWSVQAVQDVQVPKKVISYPDIYLSSGASLRVLVICSRFKAAL